MLPKRESRPCTQDHAAASVAIDHPRECERAERAERDPREQARDSGAIEMKAGSDPRRCDRDDCDRKALVKEHRDQRENRHALARRGIGSYLLFIRKRTRRRRGIIHK